MEKHKVLCPSCGSDAVELSEKIKLISEPYGKTVDVPINNYTCSICGMQGDFTGDNDDIIDKAIEDAQRSAIANIIDDFGNINISMAAIERSLDLPQRTLTKWKNGLSNPSSTGVALMNIIRTYPWILDVAQNKYNSYIARNAFISSAVTELLNIVPLVYSNVPSEVGLFLTDTSLFVLKKFDKTDNSLPRLESQPQEECTEDYCNTYVSFSGDI